MTNILPTPDISHPADEAPAAAESRDNAAKNLDTIKDLIEEAESKGTLSDADLHELRLWLEEDVHAKLETADATDAERRAHLAGQVTNKALGIDAKGVVIVPTDVRGQSDGKSPVTSGGRLT